MKTLAYWLGAALCAVVLTGSAAAKGDDDCDSSARCFHHPPPLVFSVENTGARFRAPDFPTFARLPIVRPLPNPFASLARGPFEDGFRDASASWERRRNEIKAAIEKYEIGPKPDCSDCTITATYTPAAEGSNSGS
jgi:hypothetical protein